VKTRVAILGGTGYSALELIRILLRHPYAEITAVTSRQETSLLGEVHTSLAGRTNLRLENLTPREIAERADVVFCCLPHVASMEVVPSLLEAGLRVIDLSADYRLNDASVYEKWYGHKHTDSARLANVVYGLPELFSNRIAGQRLIANPGCYTSTSILALAPLLSAGLIDPTSIIIDAKSGVSGAGRTPKLGTLYSECNENFSAYSVGSHRHTPEIEQVLSDFSGKAVQVIFTPHLVPMDRGIFATIYTRPVKNVEPRELLERFREFYEGRTFIRVIDSLPNTKAVSGTNYCDMTVRVVRGQVLVLAVLDNLVKGASGVAVQNFNLLCGYPEETGLFV
jgi:N-acetyl-gamma-glutamyl-phosphate reductase